MKILNSLNMKRVVFPFLCMVMLGVTGCMKPGDNIQCYNDGMPAIVEVSYDNIQPLPLIIVPGDEYIYAPELSDHLYTDIMEGDAIWTSFCINRTQPSGYQYEIASDLAYMKVGQGYSQGTPNGESIASDFNSSINSMEIATLIKNNLFFIFVHKAPEDQKFTYEMTYSPTANPPVLYIRAKKDGSGSKAEKEFMYPYAFNMYSFFSHYKDGSNKVSFSIQYQTGVDADGNAVYKTYEDQRGNTTIEITVK